MRDFEAIGYWFLPDNPEREIPGTLRFSQSHGLTLALSGTLSPHDTIAEAWQSSGSQKYAVIHGVTSESPYGKMFTLVDCFRSGASLHLSGLATETIRANSAYAGQSLLQEGDLRFDEFHVYFSDLANWIHLTGIQVHRTEMDAGRSEICFEHRTPENIQATFAGKPLGIEFRREAVCSRRSVTVREHIAFRISGLEQLAIDQIHQKYLHPLHNFFTFAADFPTAIDELAVINGRIRFEEADHPSAIHVLMQPQYVRAEEDKPRDADDMLFTYEDVSGFFGELVDRWVTFCGEFAPFCEAYFSAQYCPSHFVEDRFFSAVRALILMLRETSPECSAIRGRMNELRDSLALAVPRERSHWLTAALPLDAELCFPWHLREALSRNGDLLAALIGDNVEGFVDRVVATWRYVLWREPSQRPNALRGADLHWMTEKLCALIKVCILDWLKFPRDLIAKLLSRNPRYRHLKSVS